MSSTNKTAHLALNQWVGTDPFRMADFNADNQKIDAGVKANAQAIAANATAISNNAKSISTNATAISNNSKNISNNTKSIQTNASAITALQNGGLRIATGSYTGNGNYGQSNPTTLSFDFEPKLVIIRTPSPHSKNNNVCGVTLVRGVSTLQYNDTFGSGSSYCYPTWNGRSVSWYATTNHAGDQCNHSGAVYYYIAIG